MLHLYIGNKNYSSWSMRPWVLLHQAGIPFHERMVRFDAFTPESRFKQSLAGLSPTGKVPVLVDDDTAAGPVTVWDTLAIAEYLAERFPHKSLWPANASSRATARSVCAEMHSGFAALRNACPLNIEASLPEVGALLWRDNPGVRADVDHLTRMWESLLAQHGGPMLLGEFSITDAYFAPVCMRFHTYALPISATVQAYVERVRSLPSVQAWVEGALAEQDFLVFEEPYRLHR